MKDDKQLFIAMARLLEGAAVSVNTTAVLSRDLRPPLPQDFIRRCGHILGLLFDLQAEIWDQIPEETSEVACPEGTAVHLDAVLDDFEAEEDPSNRAREKQYLQENLPKEVSELVGRLDESSARAELRVWWLRQPKPYIPHEKLVEGLKNPRRYYRVRTAHLVRMRYGVVLFNEEGADVDVVKAQAWVESTKAES